MKISALINFRLCLLALLLVPFCGQAASSYESGWLAYNNNDRVEARRLFELATHDSLTRQDAFICLCMIDMDERDNNAAFAHFQSFYKIAVEPYPYLYAMATRPFMLAENGYLSPEKKAFFQTVINDPKANGTIKAVFCSRLAESERFNQNFKASEALFNQVQMVNNWQILGTFDNASGSGFSKDWGVVSHPGSKDVFVNKSGAEVNWFTPSSNREDGWFDFKYNFDMSDCIVYAQSFVKSTKDQQVILRIGTSGSLKTWINDALVLSVSEERNCDLDMYACPVLLKTGYNRVLIQIGLSEITSANFMLRLTDEAANPIPGLTSTAVQQPYNPSSTQVLPEQMPFFAESYFLKKINDEPTNLLNIFLLGDVYLKNDKAYEATKWLKKLQKTAPVSSHLSNQLIEAYIRSSNMTDKNKEYERIRLNDPKAFDAFEYNFIDAENSEKYLDAVAVTDSVRQQYKQAKETDYWVMRNLSNLKKNQELLDFVKTLYGKSPCDFSLLEVLYNCVGGADVKKNSSLLETYCANFYNEDALLLLAQHYEKNGEIKRCEKVLDKMIKNSPYAYGYLKRKMILLYGQQRYSEALGVADRMLENAPHVAYLWRVKGFCYNNMNLSALAKTAFSKALNYDPTEYLARLQLRLLDKKPDLYEYFPKTELNPLIAKAGDATTFPKDNALIVLSDYQMIVYPEGAQEDRYELAVKVLNNQGIENWKEYRVGYNSESENFILDKAEVLKKDGNVVKAEVDDNYIVFTNLEVNDVLHLVYRTQNTSTNVLARYFNSNYLFQRNLPSMKMQCSLLVPSDMPFSSFVKNGNLKPEVSDIESMKRYVWKTENTPSLPREAYSSSINDIAQQLYYSNMPNWKFISDWYSDITHNKIEADFVLQETVAELLKGKESATALEKAHIFYDYILTNISYSDVPFLHNNYVPQKASRTITTKLGDCKDVSTLFVALCRYAGINSNLVLVSTRDYGNHTMPIPMIDFNHCIAQVHADGQSYYLELTDKTLPFGSISSSDLNAEILPIPASRLSEFGDSLMVLRMPNRKQNIDKEYIRVTTSGRALKYTSRNVMYGEIASRFRSNMKDMGSEEQVKMMTQDLSECYNTSVKVTDLKMLHLDDLCDSVEVSFTCELSNVVQEVAGMNIFKMPWGLLSSMVELVNEESRQFPLEYWHYTNTDYSETHVEFILPEGKKFTSFPEAQDYRCKQALYSITSRLVTPNKLIATRKTTKLMDQVLPEEYPAFKEYALKKTESDFKQFSFQ